METICISLGGSIISRKNGINVGYVRRLYRLLKNYKNTSKFVIVVGGGYTSKLYVQSSKQIIKNNLILDEIAISITRINAMILKDMLSELNVYPNIVTDLDELRAASHNSGIVVMGGLLPGISTDSVTVLACEVVNSKTLINVSTEAYVYDRHPSEPGARRLEYLTHDQLIKLASRLDPREARSNFIFDLVASKLAKRSNIEIRFVNDKMDELRFAIEGKHHRGSTVKRV
ncbi:MAG: hypothetical protein M1122_00260 [Candidatus Marsarchaeota archaeon]|jgi:uridylate kinase|nr:hypothetical protein [Candidatus Marsarchaeota archaeon]